MNLLKIFSLLLLSNFLMAQENPGDPCGLYGPGTNGAVIDCSNGPETYTSTCCSGNPGWFWTLGGNIDIYSSTPLPLNFTINSFGFTATGTVNSASNSSIVIDWDCPEVCPPKGYVIAELTACGSEWFNPTIRIGCKACEPSVQQCYLLDCGACVGLIINGEEVEIQHTSSEAELWCFDLGEVGCSIFKCGNDNEAAKLTVNKALDFIPEVRVIDVEELKELKVSPSLTSSYSEIEVSIPYSELKTNLTITSMQGQTIVEQSVSGGSNRIQLGNLPNGIYVVTIHNPDYVYSKKIVIQN